MENISKGIKILAPAKVNLFLEIIRKRADGYHQIRSLIQPIRLFDTLWIKTGSKGLEIHCPNHPELENESNLVVRAVHLLEKELDLPLPFSVRLIKKIPIGGGLGGGSSDAAAALSGINQWLGSPILPERLRVLAARIGSDVPFFLSKETALALGRGERIEPWPGFPHWWYVLIYPGFSISTSWAYNQIKFPLTRREKTFNIRRLKDKEEIPGKEQLKNDLEAVIQPFFPVLGKIKKALWEQGCFQALMSGSGSTVFGIWENRKKAQVAYHRLKQQGWG
ncbi:MAG: 4-(cytidine 5'-diphospho)-2-C-methyl-D-erythritol kinase, partial [Deltaproteobacteria bacterium]|nr:4-(cytidine 5'-diphospho)-2-C-methyl-D-erythritol kinase [Deltaproteobacteria bacterium]